MTAMPYTVMVSKVHRGCKEYSGSFKGASKWFQSGFRGFQRDSRGYKRLQEFQMMIKESLTKGHAQSTNVKRPQDQDQIQCKCLFPKLSGFSVSEEFSGIFYTLKNGRF